MREIDDLKLRVAEDVMTFLEILGNKDDEN